MNYKKEEIREHLEDTLEGYNRSKIIELIKDDELHHEIFNTDYYIIGTYEAKQWLGEEVLSIIGFIKDYEMDNFGELYTDLTSAESIVNMYVYIIGEELIHELYYKESK